MYENIFVEDLVSWIQILFFVKMKCCKKLQPQIKFDNFRINLDQDNFFWFKIIA